MSNLLPYQISENENVKLSLIDDNIWITEKEMARLFDVEIDTIDYHLKEIFKSGEMDESQAVQQKEDSREVKSDVSHYNLDAIFAVGYRVDSPKATMFRKWSTQVLYAHAQDGYVLDEAALQDDPQKLNQLAAKVRALRANEKNVYEKVRECFRISASDYNLSQEDVRKFYILLQEKFHHAVTRMTSSKLIMDRAAYNEDHMGLVSFKNSLPTKKEALIGKNYLTKEELYRMYLLSEQFLLFAEASALMKKQLTMKNLHEQLDRLLELNGYPVFEGFTDYIRARAADYAEREHKKYTDLKKLEMLGIEVDILDYDAGFYEQYRSQIDAISTQRLNKHYIALQAV